jgi:translation initiation factor IF-2
MLQSREQRYTIEQEEELEMPTRSKKKDSAVEKDTKPQVEIPAFLTVNQLAEILGVSAVEVIKQLMRNDIMANINQTIDFETAAIVATDFDYEALQKSTPEPSFTARRQPQEENLVPRSPVVTVMGHIDHGKTSLLDAIRQTNVIATEAGSITQHIGAYQVEVNGQKITFLDTPGHEAFTAMRARGARATDIAVLVVAADDGLMPQTIEAIAHARAADVPIVVAINKIDKANINVELVKKQLAEQELLIEEWGGDIVCVSVSAKKNIGISELLENILVVAEILELKANPDSPAEGVVIEAELDKTKGPLATVLIQSGTIKLGDAVIVSDTWGKIKAMFNDKGKRVKTAGPSTPVNILGLNSVPQAGELLSAAASDREARNSAQKRHQEKQLELSKPIKGLTLDGLLSQFQEGQLKELNIVLKTDVQGSIEPIRDSLEQLDTEEIKVKIIHFGSGAITESDILLALASKGIVIGFNTRPDLGARRLAELEGVDIRSYNVIYEIIDDVKRALKGMAAPTYVDAIEGHAEVREVFPSDKLGKVAGVYVTDGKVSRDALVKIIRGGQVLHESTLSSLKRFKSNVKEVLAGFECGIGIHDFDQFEIGDVIEVYRKEQVDESAH